MNQVLGISVTDLEIASVVADSDTGEVLARNFVELPSSSPDHVFDAIYQLVESAPIVPSAITIACADSATTLAIGDIINSGQQVPAEPGVAATTPDWLAQTTVVGTPVAYAEIAAAVFGARGVVLVADLDRSGALFPGQSVALVDTDTRVVVGASEISGVGTRPPVTEPDGAQLLADAVGVIGNPTGALQGIAVLGPGAAVPGVAPSLEYALQLPVQVTEDGQYAAAYGAALVAASTTVVRGNNSRWVLLSAAAAAALFIAVGVVAAVVMTGDSSIPKSAVDDRSTTQSTTSTTTTTTTTKKSTPRPRISSPTLPPETTQAPVTTEEPTVVTVVPPPTTITQTPPPPSSTQPTETTTTTTTTVSTPSTTTTTSVEPSLPDDAANPPPPGAAPPETGAE